MLMDDKQKATIDKIVLLSKQNPEFGAELRKRLKMTSSDNGTGNNDGRIERIEKYLGLDYYVDTMSSNFDYSFVNPTEIRDKLISDNREMMRFRYGTRYHKIDFDEFCRYAHLQVEMLLNYFYDVKNNSDIPSIIRHIKKYNPGAKFYSPNTLSEITFNSKLWAFCTEMNIGRKLKENIEMLRIARNRLSHRSTEKNDFNIDDYRNELKSFKIPMYADGRVDFNRLNQDVIKKNIYDTELKCDYDNYLFEPWYLSKPFDDIVRNIDDFARIMSSHI